MCYVLILDLDCLHFRAGERVWISCCVVLFDELRLGDGVDDLGVEERLPERALSLEGRGVRPLSGLSAHLPVFVHSKQVTHLWRETNQEII